MRDARRKPDARGFRVPGSACPGAWPSLMRAAKLMRAWQAAQPIRGKGPPVALAQTVAPPGLKCTFDPLSSARAIRLDKTSFRGVRLMRAAKLMRDAQSTRSSGSASSDARCTPDAPRNRHCRAALLIKLPKIDPRSSEPAKKAGRRRLVNTCANAVPIWLLTGGALPSQALRASKVVRRSAAGRAGERGARRNGQAVWSQGTLGPGLPIHDLCHPPRVEPVEVPL